MIVGDSGLGPDRGVDGSELAILATISFSGVEYGQERPSRTLSRNEARRLAVPDKP